MKKWIIIFPIFFLSIVYLFAEDSLNTNFFKAIENDDIENVNILLKKGVNINIKDKFGWTALMIAAENGYLDLVKMLIQNNCDINLLNNSGETAYDCAERHNFSDLMKILKPDSTKITSNIENQDLKSNPDKIDKDLLSFWIYGDDFNIDIALPNTWQVDMDYAHEVGVNGFFYLKNFNIKNSPVGIILKLAYKRNDNKLEDWIDYDLDNVLYAYKDTTIKKLDWDLKSKNGYKIIVYQIENKKMNMIQYSAYIDAGLHYFANIYITIKDNKGKYLDD